MPHVRVASVLLLIGLSGCGAPSSVLRRDGAQTALGRGVSGTAYAWFLRGQWYEAANQLAEAEYSYEQGLREDPRSGAVYAALARVRCLQGNQKTEDTFSQGKSRSDELLPLLIEESVCALARGKPGLAIRAARDAVELSPSDPRASLTLFAALERSEGESAAENVARGFELWTGRPLPRSTLRAPEHHLPSPLEARIAVDRFLRTGDLTRARSAGAGVIGSGEIALRAALLGASTLAQAQAETTLILDPSDFDARVALIIVHSQLGSEPEVRSSAAPASVSELGTLALARQVALWDEEAAAQLRALSFAASERDPLVQELRRELVQPQDGAR